MNVSNVAHTQNTNAGSVERDRFPFGRNWASFLGLLDESRIREAERSLTEMLGRGRISGATFLDAGSGSGLFSLAAIRLGASRVHSFDFDPESVGCTQELRRRYFPAAEHWTVEQASVLDRGYLERLGQWDIVYSWGVLHHTGDMWKALDLVALPVAPSGRLFIAIYNDQGRRSRAWTTVKRVYNWSRFGKGAVLSVLVPYNVARGLAVDVFRRKNPFARYREYQYIRGMSMMHDWKDWFGGYPFEVATPDEIFDFFHECGFQLTRLKHVAAATDATNSCSRKPRLPTTPYERRDLERVTDQAKGPRCGRGVLSTWFPTAHEPRIRRNRFGTLLLFGVAPASRMGGRVRPADKPACVAELGPGDSLGTGLAAVLCGAEHYLALDAKAHASVDTNLKVLDELIALFRARAPIPDDNEFPLVQPKLADYTFPHDILPLDRLSAALAEQRLKQIRAAISGQPSVVTVAYRAPWSDPSILVAGSVDFLISQAVLEHVEDLDTTYRAMHDWMKPGASMSHSIDFSSHELTRWWNGHWTLGDASWRIVRGTRRYLINREPFSTHLALLAKYSFETVRVDRRRAPVSESFRPAGRFRSMSAEDRFTRGVFLQARAGPG